MKKSYDHNPFETLDEAMKREAREKKIARVKESSNRALESIGDTFRGVLALPESHNKDTNRRAGRTAIAIGLLVLGGLTGLASNAEKPTCEYFQLSGMPSRDPHQAAADIVTALNATEISDAYDSIESDFLNPTDGKVPGTEICGTDAIIQVHRMIEQKFDVINDQPFGN